MKIERKLIERLDIAEFAERHGLTMEVHERERDSSMYFTTYPFYAEFKGAEVKEGVCLISAFGDGDNEESAIRDYANEISGKLLVFNAFGKDRYEIKVPYLSYNPKEKTGKR